MLYSITREELKERRDNPLKSILWIATPPIGDSRDEKINKLPLRWHFLTRLGNLQYL